MVRVTQRSVDNLLARLRTEVHAGVQLVCKAGPILGLVMQ